MATLYDLRDATTEELIAIQSAAGPVAMARGITLDRLGRAACDAAGIPFRGEFPGRRDWAEAVRRGAVILSPRESMPAELGTEDDVVLLAVMVSAKREWDARN